MRRHASLLSLLLSLLLSGCAIWQGQRVPNYARDAAEPAVDPIPVIKVVMTHQHKMEGDPRDTWAEGPGAGFFERAFTDTSQKSVVMRRASVNPVDDVHYVLFIDTQLNEHGEAMAFVSGLTLMLFPVVIKTDISATASLYEAATGKEIGVYEATSPVNTLIWLPLFPVTPLTIALGPARRPYEDAMRGVFMQLANQLQDRTLPEAVDPARLDIRRVPDHIQREIRVI